MVTGIEPSVVGMAPLVSLLFEPWLIHGAMGLLTIMSIITAVQYLYENRHLFRVLANGSVARTPS